jgi:AcrR family transcriptional regulator
MNPTKQDPRATKTKDALHTAFSTLLFEQGYEALKISDVALRAQVGRSTFYEHFKTKQDLLKASLERPLSALSRVIDLETSSENLVPFLVHFYDNRRLARVLLAWPTRTAMTTALTERNLSQLKLRFRGMTRPILPVAAIAKHLAHAQIALLEDWLVSASQCTPATMAIAMTRSSRAIVEALTQRGLS